MTKATSRQQLQHNALEVTQLLVGFADSILAYNNITLLFLSAALEFVLFSCSLLFFFFLSLFCCVAHCFLVVLITL